MDNLYVTDASFFPSIVASLAFGGRNRSQLFLCGSHTLYSIHTNVRGAGLP